MKTNENRGPFEPEIKPERAVDFRTFVDSFFHEEKAQEFRGGKPEEAVRAFADWLQWKQSGTKGIFSTGLKEEGVEKTDEAFDKQINEMKRITNKLI